MKNDANHGTSVRRVRYLIAAVCVGLVGCAGSADQSDREGRSSSGPVPQLPSSQLLGFDPAQQTLLREARDILIDGCMEDRGFDYIPYPEIDADLISMADLYGSISVEQASQFGYHNPNARAVAKVEQEQELYEQRIAEEASDEYFAALNGDSDSCRSEAHLALYGSDSPPGESSAALRVLELAGETLTMVNSSPSFATAAEGWRSCMNESGYDVEVLSDSRMTYEIDPSDTRPPSDDERSLALADANCRLESDLDSTVVELYSEEFTRLLENNVGLEEELNTAFETAETRALDLLGSPSAEPPTSPP